MSLATDKIRKNLSSRLTVMLIPHGNFRPLRLNISMAFLIFFAAGWSGLTLWSGFIASRHVDYWRARTDENILRAKVWYFSQQVKQSREYMDRVRETEIALQSLLNMKTRKAIVEADHSVGGPTSTDQRQLIALLNGQHDLITIDDMTHELQNVKAQGTDVMADFSQISSYIKDQHDLFRARPTGWPTEGRITSPFGVRKSPFEGGDGEFHRGLDIANSLGTPVRTTADGVVQVASWQGGYGRLVIIDHGHGYRTYYGHNSQILVQPGDHVKRGQVISYMGTSGRSTGDHLHYEVWQNGRAVNPIAFVKNQEN